MITCATALNVPLFYYFYRWNKRVSGQYFGSLIFDFIFFEGHFAMTPGRRRHLPEISLLQHWRDTGRVRKAWRTAKSHLFNEPRALPVWSFAIETAVLYLRKPSVGLKLLKRLCHNQAFSYDHRLTLVNRTHGWMEAAGFAFDPATFTVKRPEFVPAGWSVAVEQKCREGRFSQAEEILRGVLAEDSLNEQAFTQLVRLYCQDMKKRDLAVSLIAKAQDTFSSNLLNFLSQSLDEWMRLPLRSHGQTGGWLDRMRRKPAVPDSPQKLVITFGKAPEPAKEAVDPLDEYLQLVREAKPKEPDLSTVQDPVERLLLARRLGTAVERLQQLAEAQPRNFELWLRYAEVHGLHVGNLSKAEKIIDRMEHSGFFQPEQLQEAKARLAAWRNRHSPPQSRW